MTQTNKTIAKENVARINKALFFIEEHLNEKLSLETIAASAHFSAFHFHRLFSVVVGETVHNYINRKRIEKAASFLLHKKDWTTTEIAEKTGFASLSAFSRSFKQFYGISPSEFKKESPDKYSKISKTESKDGKTVVTFEQYIYSINNALKWIKMNAKTEIITTEEMQLAYINHKGSLHALGNVYQQLMQWAGPKGLMAQPNVKMVTIYHDSPKITDPNQLRMSACITLNSPMKADGIVNLRTLASTKCIVSRFELNPTDFQQAWESSFVWMNEHGYSKADQDPFEIYHNNPQEHPEGKFIVDLCIPVN